jgi:glycosyltransferase involved in cell wall biosynthesis
MSDQFNKTSTWIIIPAYNEDKVIGNVVTDVCRRGYSVVVVDDSSSDRTAEVALAAGAFVCRHAINLGQGAALQTGISFALRKNAQYLVTFDADGQHQADEIAAILAPLQSGTSDVTLGSRFLRPESAPTMPPLRRKILHLATLFTRFTTGLELTDTHNGFRGFTRTGASKLSLRQDRMAHASEILTEIADKKLRYQEVPVTILYTDYSLAKGQKLSNSFNILWESCTGILRR